MLARMAIHRAKQIAIPWDDFLLYEKKEEHLGKFLLWKHREHQPWMQALETPTARRHREAGPRC